MGSHDDYGKNLMFKLLSDRWSSWDSRRSIDEAGVRSDLDGIIKTADGEQVECAVEIEARVYKQIRGAIVDLALLSAPKKLLVVIKAQPQLRDTQTTMNHCRFIWEHIAGATHGDFGMTVLKGTGDSPLFEDDLELLKGSLKQLAILE